jgi:antitoxin HicB
MFDYPVDLTPDGDTILVTSPDFPELTTFGEDEADALLHARDALESVIMLYISDRLPLPQPSPARSRQVVHLPLLSAMKVAVYTAMTERGWRKADLARALGVNARQVDRLLDLDHQTPAAQIERALAVLGKEAVFSLKAA